MSKLICSVLSVLIFISNVFTFVPDEEECLPVNVFPVEYDLTIIPYGEYYRGDVIIRLLSTVTGINQLSLDSQDLKIEDTSLTRGDLNLLDPSKPFVLDNQNGKLHIYLCDSMTANTFADHELRIRFLGKIKKNGQTGIFIRNYQENGKHQPYITTRNAPKFASTVFPCFDEPQYKSIYKIRIYKPYNYQDALSLTKIRKQYDVQSRYEVCEYLPTPQISSHQVVFLLTNMERNHLQHSNISLWTDRHSIQRSAPVLQTAEHLRKLMREYVGFDSIGSIYFAALPNFEKGYDRGSYSLVTVSSTKILPNPDQTSAKQEDINAFELSRQMSRIWLGNPITKTRWKEQWLKEGLATFYGYYFLSESKVGHLDWDVYSQVMTQRAMSLDEKAQTLADFNNITEVTSLPKETEAFYALKAASLIRMIEGWIGTDVFHSIMARFFQIMRGKYVTAHNLGEYLQEKSIHCEFFKGFSVNDVFNTYVTQSKYPVVNVKVYTDHNVVSLTQKPYEKHGRTEKGRFLIPISYSTQYKDGCINCLAPRFTIGHTEEYSFKENLNGGWILLNRNGTGYYRVNYDKLSWSLIAQTLNGPERTVIDNRSRAQLINDVFALYLSGDIDMNTAKWILNSLDGETDLLVWISAAQGFQMLKNDEFKISQQEYKCWKKFMQEKVKRIYWKIQGSNNKDSIEKRLLRSYVTTFACQIEYEPCVEEMRGHFDDLFSHSLDPDLREAVLTVAGRDPRQANRLIVYSERCDPHSAEDLRRVRDYILMERATRRPNTPFVEPLYTPPQDHKEECKMSCSTRRPTVTAGTATLQARVGTLILAISTILLQIYYS